MLRSTHVNHLDRAELEYELQVRGKSNLEGVKMEDMRKTLRKYLSKEKSGTSESIPRTGDADEVRICQLKLREIGKLIGLLSLPDRNTDVKKLQRKLEATLIHTKLRIGRLGSEWEEGQIEMDKEVSDLITQFEKLTGQHLQSKVQLSNSSEEESDRTNAENKGDKNSVLVSNAESSDSSSITGELNENFLKKRSKNKKKKSHRRRKGRRRSSSSSTTSSTSECSDDGKTHRMCFKSKTTPVRHWNLKFSGDDNTSVGAFLADVEDRRVANNMSFRELFLAAGDLFLGSALVVYRSCRGRIDSWQELEVKLRNAFQDPDYDRRLVREIESRKQGLEETVTVYIAKMRSLFSRLTKPKHEEDMLDIIEENILPDYQSALALQTYSNVDQLEKILLRLEKGRLRALRFDTKPSRNLLEPDLAYKPKTRRDNVRVSAFESRSVNLERNQSKPKRSSSAVTCWNCKLQGHVFSDCRKPRTIFCYGCGKENVIKSKCPTCNTLAANNAENFSAERLKSGPRSAETKPETE